MIAIAANAACFVLGPAADSVRLAPLAPSTPPPQPSPPPQDAAANAAMAVDAGSSPALDRSEAAAALEAPARRELPVRSLAGVTFRLQVVGIELGAAGNVSLSSSNGLELTVGLL